jgi:hypothetical protein
LIWSRFFIFRLPSFSQKTDSSAMSRLNSL